MDMQQPPAIIEVVSEAIWNTRISRQLSSRRDADTLAAAAIEAYEKAKDREQRK
jgi:hypothetical protein